MGSAEQTRDESVATQRRQQVQEAVRTWTGELTDLGGRNQLLFYRDLKVGTLDLGDADPVAVESLLNGRTIALSRLFREGLTDRLKRARAIRNKSREGIEERGIATCFLTLGMATWNNSAGTATPSAPILLREATIAAEGAAEEDFEIALTGETDINPTLLRFLSQQFRIDLDAAELQGLLDSAQFTPQPVFDRILKETGAVAGFSIAPRRLIGTFSFAKLPMVNDLQNNLEALTSHEVVAAIAGHRPSQVALSSAGTSVTINRPDHQSPNDEFLVLDADSSQSFAINAAVSGQSVVVSGPPGTGKSQTIANLIATHVARGQSVLFVAEKRAAIAAVLGRLEGVGLDGLVLDLHQGSGSKKAIAEKLAAGLAAASAVAQPNQTELHEQLVDKRSRLVSRDDALHRSRVPWDVSVYDAQATLVGIRENHGDSAETRTRLTGRALAALTSTAIRKVRADLTEYVNLGGLRIPSSGSPWAGATISSSEQAEQALQNATRLEKYTAPDNRQTLDRILKETGLSRPQTLPQWSGLLTLLEQLASVFSRFRPAVFELPLPQAITAVATGAWRKENPNYSPGKMKWTERRRLRKTVRALWIGSDMPTDLELHKSLLLTSRVLRKWKDNSSGYGPPRVPSQLAQAQGRFEQLNRELAALGAFVTGFEFSGMSEQQLQAHLAALTRDEQTLRKLPRLNELESSFKRLGLGELLAELQQRQTDSKLAVAAFDTCWLNAMLDRVNFDDRNIANFDGALHHDTVEAFKSTDIRHISQTSSRVLREAAEWLIAVRNIHPDQGQLVQQQSGRKRGHLPLRQLFSAAPDVMTALKPCWAMSPLVVSQLLPGDRPYFDVVVFDEASQIVPADAIPAILRAKRVVVAGDRHQLPPTGFFSAASDGDGDDGVDQAIADDGSINLSLASGYESILDVLSAGLGENRTRALTWHYRSRDERLIAFSNAWVYDNSLKTFPGVIGKACLSHELVDQQSSVTGQQDSVTGEVQRVVQLILDHAVTRPEESLGVITMGVKHADRVDAALRDELKGRPDLHAFFDDSRADKFFVKNLERVQGDERDAIILTVGYGKTAEGRLPYHFGPLLQDGGHRRLNVAITRARSRMTLVSSFSHHDMDPNRSDKAGVKMLRAYLQYAASGGENLGDEALAKPSLNPFEISIRDRLLAADIPVVAQYGVAGYWIDFAAQHPVQSGRMVLAIEADGASYHSSPTARDRDRLRQEQLERLGWKFHRIWSTDWFSDPDTCIAKVRTAYDLAVAASDSDDAAQAKRTSQVADPDAGQENVPTMSQPSYMDGGGTIAAHPAPNDSPKRPSPRPGIRAGLPITEYSQRDLVLVLRWIESDTLLRTEEQLFAAFLEELGFKRRGSRIRAAFERALPLARHGSG